MVLVEPGLSQFNWASVIKNGQQSHHQLGPPALTRTTSRHTTNQSNHYESSIYQISQALIINKPRWRTSSKLVKPPNLIFTTLYPILNFILVSCIFFVELKTGLEKITLLTTYVSKIFMFTTIMRLIQPPCHIIGLFQMTSNAW